MPPADMRRDKRLAADTCLVDMRLADKHLADNHPAADRRIAVVDIALEQAVQLLAAGFAPALVERSLLVREQLMAALRQVRHGRAPLALAPLRRARCVLVPLKAAPSQATLHVQLVAASQYATARLQSLRSTRCKRNMSRY